MITRSAVLAEARDWIGTPYQHQASAKHAGCDCLGLVRGVWRALYGAEPEEAPAYTPDWAERHGAETLMDAARRQLNEVLLADARARRCAALSHALGCNRKARRHSR